MENQYPARQKTILLVVGMILLAGIISLALLRERIVNPPLWQVTIMGQGKINYQPDIAVVLLGVNVERIATAAQALNKLNENMDKVFAAVKESGIPEEDIQTQNYSLYPQYDYINEISVLVGYNANQQIAVKVRNLKSQPDLVAKLIARTTAAGANRVEGVSFEVSNLEELKQQARIKALADAKSKSQDLAAAAGVKLTKVVGWWENIVQQPGIGQPSYFDGKGGGGGSPGTIPTGLQELIIDIGLNYQVK